MGKRWRRMCRRSVGLGLALALGAGLWALAAPGARSASPAEGSASAESAPVRLDGRTVLPVAPAAGLTARVRADYIEDRLEAILAEPGPEPRWRVEKHEGGYDLYAGDRFVMSVTAADAALAPGTSVSQLAQADKTRLERAVERSRFERSWPYLVRQLLIALLLTILAVLGAWGVSRLYRLARRDLEGGRTPRPFAWARRMAVSDAEVRPVLLGAERWGLRLAWAAIAGLWFFWVLGLFPRTRAWARTFFQLVEGTVSKLVEGGVAYLPQLLSITLILFFTYYGVRLIQFVFGHLARDPQAAGFDTSPELMRVCGQMLSLLAWLFAIMVIAPMLPGLGTQTGQALALIFGAMITLGSTTVVGNAMAGFTLLLMRPFDVGDRILLGTVEGDVVDRRLTMVRLRTIQNELVSFPSMQVLGMTIVNYSASVAKHGAVAIRTEATIGYDVPYAQVEALFLEAAARTEGVLQEPAPRVLVLGFQDHAVSYRLMANVVDIERHLFLVSALNERVLETFAEAGVEILSPTYFALRDGNAATLPPANLPAGYEAPAFRVWPLSRWPRKPSEPPPGS